MELALGAVLVLVAVAFVITPLVRRRPGPTAAAPMDDDAGELTARRRAVYREILDLELDHRVGKLDQGDYRELSEACLARAASLLAEEDARASALDARAEREIAAMRDAVRRRAPVATGTTEAS